MFNPLTLSLLFLVVLTISSRLFFAYSSPFRWRLKVAFQFFQFGVCVFLVFDFFFNYYYFLRLWVLNATIFLKESSVLNILSSVLCEINWDRLVWSPCFCTMCSCFPLGLHIDPVLFIQGYRWLLLCSFPCSHRIFCFKMPFLL